MTTATYKRDLILGYVHRTPFEIYPRLFFVSCTAPNSLTLISGARVALDRTNGSAGNTRGYDG